MDRTAIERIEELANGGLINIKGQVIPAVTLPSSMTVHYLESILEHRSRFRGTMTTDSLQSFVEYCHGQATDVIDSAGHQVYIDKDKMAARAFFNLWEDGSPGHGDHHATLTLPKTAAYKALLAIDGVKMSQKELAECLEDWRDYLVPLDQDMKEIHPVAKVIAAVRNINIKAVAATGHVDKQFSATRSSLAEIEASSPEGLPGYIRFMCAPYDGLPNQDYLLRPSIITSDPPKLALRIVRLEHAKEVTAQAFATLLQVELANAAATYIGSFTP